MTGAVHAVSQGKLDATGVISALLAAVSFGGNAPFAKILLGEIAPLMLAGLLYLGSGLGLLGWYIIRVLVSADHRHPGAGLTMSDLPWLLGDLKQRIHKL